MLRSEAEFELLHLALQRFDLFAHALLLALLLHDNLGQFFQRLFLQSVSPDLARSRSQDIEAFLVLFVFDGLLFEVDAQVVHFMQVRVLSDQQSHEVDDETPPPNLIVRLLLRCLGVFIVVVIVLLVMTD